MKTSVEIGLPRKMFDGRLDVINHLGPDKNECAKCVRFQHASSIISSSAVFLPHPQYLHLAHGVYISLKTSCPTHNNCISSSCLTPKWPLPRMFTCRVAWLWTEPSCVLAWWKSVLRSLKRKATPRMMLCAVSPVKNMSLGLSLRQISRNSSA